MHTHTLVSRRLEGMPSIAVHPPIFITSSVEFLDFAGDQSTSTSRNQVDSVSLGCQSKPRIAADVEDADVLS